MDVDANPETPSPLSPRERARQLLEELRLERRIAAALLVLFGLALWAVQVGYAVAADRFLAQNPSSVSDTDTP